MRKLLLSLFALLTVGGAAWADGLDVTGKTFTLTASGTRGAIRGNGSNLVKPGSEEEAGRFAIINYEDETYLYDVDNQKFIVHEFPASQVNAGNNKCLESSTDFAMIVKGVTFIPASSDTYDGAKYEGKFLLEESNGFHLGTGGSGVVFNTWSWYDDGNYFTVDVAETEFDDTEAVKMLEDYYNTYVSIYYRFKDTDGKVLLSSDRPVSAIIGQKPEIPSDLMKPFCTYELAEVEEAEQTIDVTVTWNMPFEASESYDNAKWYYLKLRDRYVCNADGNISANNSNYNEQSLACQWAFIGNPYTGIKVLNAQTKTYFANGDGKVILSETGFAYPIDAKDESTFGLKNGSNYLNDFQNDGKIGFYWDFKNDGGSQFTVEEVPVYDVTYSVMYNNEQIATVQVSQQLGSKPSVPKAQKTPFAVYSYSADVITEATTITATIESLNMPFTASESADNATWYYVKLRDHFTYYDVESGEIRTNQSSREDGTTYQWAFIGNPFDGIKVVNRETKTYFANTANKVELSSEAYTWKISDLEGNPDVFGLHNGSNYINEQNYNNHNLIYWGAFESDRGSQFTVEEVPVTEATLSITDAHYATFVAPFDVAIPENVSAFKVTDTDDTTLVLDEVTETIPAGTPVLLYSESEIEETVSGQSTYAEEATCGLLTGVYTNTTAEEGWYVLQNQSGKVGFYQVQNTKPTVGANRAYLNLPAGSNVKAFYFDNDDATAISAVESKEEGSDAIYNIAGQRVQKTAKGIYIIGGKKIAVK